MTDKELIKVLQCCQKTGSCLSCEALEACYGIESVLGQAGDRLEALLDENAELQEKVELLVENGCTMRKEIQKLIFEKSGLELEIGRLETERDHFRDLTKKLWCEKQYGKDTNVPTSAEGVE